MGEWKAQISLRVTQDLRRNLEEFANHDRRKLGNLTEILIEWAFKQLKVAGSVDRLMKIQLIKPEQKESNVNADTTDTNKANRRTT